MANDTLADLAASTLTDNPDLRDRIHRLVDQILASAEYTLKYGTPTERNQLMRSIVPSLLKSMQAADTETGDNAQAQAYQRMLEAMSGGARAD